MRQKYWKKAQKIIRSIERLYDHWDYTGQSADDWIVSDLLMQVKLNLWRAKRG